MIHYFGSVTCLHCQKQNRLLLEQSCPTDHFLVIGDKVIEEIRLETNETTCEYCFKDFSVYALEKDGVFTTIANKEEMELYQSHPENLEKAEEGYGLKQEINLERQFKQTFTFPFEQQPFKKDQTLYLLEEEWVIENVYKKEHSERDYEKRMQIDYYDSYYYEIRNESGELKWLEVVDDVTGNGSMSNENPVVLEHETLYQINESEFKSTFLFHQELGVQYDLEVYQHLSGVQMLVIRKDEEERVIVLDMLGDSAEELLLEVEEWLNVAE